MLFPTHYSRQESKENGKTNSKQVVYLHIKQTN